jgi:hypothetical protein
MHTATAGRAQLGEEVGDAHGNDAVCCSRIKGLGGLPVGYRGSDGGQRREAQTRLAGGGC